MYIVPNSYIRLMKNIPLDNSYTDTLFFTSKANQTSYFLNSTTGRNFSAQSYQRVQREYIRLEVNAELIYDYNYLMFQNTAYGTRWFYAFINNVEYINDNTTEIHFEIDVMQTWLFDVTLGASYVEREHFSEDTVGMNIQPEPVDIGPIKCNSITRGGLDDYSIVVFFADSGFSSPFPIQSFNGYVGGLFSGCNFMSAALNAQNAQTIVDFINDLTSNNKADIITNIVLCPTDFIPTTKTEAREQSFSVNRPTTCGSYTPRNNKLLTAPYTFLCVDTLNDQQNYRYEWSTDPTNIKFHLIASFTPNPTANVYPLDYNGAYTPVGGSMAINPTESVTIEGYPQCAYSIDCFRAWLAQRAAGDIIGIGNSSISAGAGMSFSGSTGGRAMLGHGIAGIAGGAVDAIIEATKGARAHGASTSDADIAGRQKDVYFKKMSVTAEYAEIIDDFFDRYGYACNQLKIPNRNARAHWTYCKTRDCNLENSHAPADDLKKIKSIYDKGITWWNTPSEVGHYELLNTPNG